jgi:hypothetical protein
MKTEQSKSENPLIQTTHPIRKIPFVPSAVRDMPYTIHPVKSRYSDKERARERWNSEADGYNQWDSLGQDEKDELIQKEKGMNKQPYYHDAHFSNKLSDNDASHIVDSVKRMRTVIKDTVEFSIGNDELLFTATSDVTRRAGEVIRSCSGGSALVGEVECEPGDPADLM